MATGFESDTPLLDDVDPFEVHFDNQAHYTWRICVNPKCAKRYSATMAWAESIPQGSCFDKCPECLRRQRAEGAKTAERKFGDT